MATAFEIVDRFYSGFHAILTTPDLPLTSIGETLPLPQFAHPEIVSLCELALEHFRCRPIVVRINRPVSIVGDIHGSFGDLVRILRAHSLHTHYLFLGDYVDRGPFSLECIMLVFTLMLKFPDQITLLRGNHEIRKIAENYGFKQELSAEYPDVVFDAFCEAFSWMPLAAIVQNHFFCVHGGIGPQITSIAHIEGIERPILTDTSDDVKALLWADPSDTFSRFGESMRGHTTVYGALAVANFLQATSLHTIIRAHECVDGVRVDAGMPVVTVFSASNYDADTANGSGVVVINETGEMAQHMYPPLERIRREDAIFFLVPRKRLGRGPATQSYRIGRLIAPVAVIGSHRDFFGSKRSVGGVPVSRSTGPVIVREARRRSDAHLNRGRRVTDGGVPL
jgi:protein phosphatase